MKSSEKMSIADLICVIGVVLLGLICFVGFNISSGGDMSPSVVKALLIAGGSYGVILFMFYAATQDVVTRGWMIAECVGGLLYVLVAFLAFEPFSHCLFVEFGKDKIRNVANRELNEMNEMTRTYKEENSKYLQAFETNLNNILFDNPKNSLLIKLLNPNTPGPEAIQAEVSAKQAVLLQKGDSSVVKKITERYKLVFDSWNRFKISQNVRAFEEDRVRLYANLCASMEEAKLPRLKRNGYDNWEIEGYYEFDYQLGDSELSSLLENGEAAGMGTWIAFVFVQVLILLKYIFAPRSQRKNISSKTVGEDGGGRFR